MSYEQLNNDVLRQVAEQFGVGLDPKDTKKVIIGKLIEDGVSWEMYKEAFPDIEDIPDESQEDEKPVENKEEPVTVRPKPTVLLKMERQNPRFEIRGYTFSKTHPFLPVTEDDANYILTHEEGFRIAMPQEAEEFYS